MSSPSKTNINIVLGAMTFGLPGREQSRVHDISDVKAIIDIFHQHGHNEIDTARFYGGGSSEEYLGQLDLPKQGFALDTKFFPTINIGGDKTHSPEHLREALQQSLTALKVKKVDMWYLHAPDRTTPYEITLRAVNELHKEGLFDRFGISNYASWEVAEIVGICEKNGWIKPSVYQGVYNAVHRVVEPELLPCLRKFGISFFAFGPLAGGFFTGAYNRSTTSVEQGSRFDESRLQGQMYRKRYWNEPYFQALDIVRPVAEKYGLTLVEVALRWMTWHSFLKPEYGDAILIGASSIKQIEGNLIDFEKGPLPDEVVQTLDKAWEVVKPLSFRYFH